MTQCPGEYLVDRFVYDRAMIWPSLNNCVGRYTSFSLTACLQPLGPAPNGRAERGWMPGLRMITAVLCVDEPA